VAAAIAPVEPVATSRATINTNLIQIVGVPQRRGKEFSMNWNPSRKAVRMMRDGPSGSAFRREQVSNQSELLR
jgi:hypothetical protein